MLGLVDSVHLLFCQLQLVAGDAESQHELLLCGFSPGALALQAAVVPATEDQTNGDAGKCCPAHESLGKKLNQLLLRARAGDSCSVSRTRTLSMNPSGASSRRSALRRASSSRLGSL